MEKIGAVIFLGLVMSTIAQGSILLDQCRSVQEKSGFDRQQFFRGDWFVTHARDGTDLTLCRKYSISENSGKLGVKYGNGIGRQVICTEKKKNSQAPHDFNCDVKQDGQTEIEYDVQYTIVETDGNSALFYRCQEFGRKYVDTYQVLNRNAGGAVSQDVRDAISAQSLDFGKFLSRSSVTCRP